MSMDRANIQTTINKEPTWLERKGTKIGVALTLALGAATLTACSASGEAAPQHTVITAEHGRTFDRLFNPSLCVSPNNDPNFIAPTVIECGKFDSLTPKEQQIVLEGEQSTPEQFFKLPVPNQEAFQNFVIDNNSEKALFYANDELNTLGLSGDAYSIKFNPNYHPQSEGEATENGQIATNLAVYNHLAYKDANTGEITYDKDTARKILPAIAAPGSAAYNALLNGIETAQDQPFRATGTAFGINAGNPYAFMPFVNVTDGDEKTLSNGVKVQQKTAETTQIVQSSSASGWVLPYGDVKISYDQVETATLDGKGTVSVLLENITAAS